MILIRTLQSLLIVSLFLVPKLSMASEAEIRKFFTDFTGAMNRRDYPAIGTSWSSNGELFSLAGGIYRGRAEIQRFFEDGLPASYQGATFSYEVQYVRLLDEDHATVDGAWKVTGGGPAGYPACGIFLFNLSKRESRWQIDVSYSTAPRRGHTSEHGRTLSWTRFCDGR